MEAPVSGGTGCFICAYKLLSGKKPTKILTLEELNERWNDKYIPFLL